MLYNYLTSLLRPSKTQPAPLCIPLGAPLHLDACLHLGLLQGGAQLLHLGGQGLHPLVHLPLLILCLLGSKQPRIKREASVKISR